MEIHCVNGVLMIVFSSEPINEEHLSTFKREFARHSGFVDTFFFDTRQLVLPSVKIMWGFGSFMLGIRPKLRGKRTYVNAPSHVQTFLNGFFRVFKPVTEIVWTDLSHRDIVLNTS